MDDEDYDRLAKLRWCAIKAPYTFYAARTINRKRKFSRQRMHRVVLGLPEGEGCVDHINGDGLDNRKANLRRCSRSQNAMNQKKKDGTSSRYKGVSWNKADGKWHASIGFQKKRISLGSFDSELAAAKEYDRAARRLFGDFARPNFASAVSEAQ